MPNTCNGLSLLRATVRMPRIGRWHADVEIAGSNGPTTTATALIEGVTFSGYLLRGDAYGDRWRGRILGGAGGLGKKIAAKNYAYLVTGNHVIADILREAGETLSKTADTGILGAQLGSWERVAQSAGKSLTDITKKLGAVWRVLADGTVWVGSDSYPAPKLKAYTLTEDDETSGVVEIAPTAPDLTPGVTLLDRKVEYVIHRLEPGSLRSEAYPRDPAAAMSDTVSGSPVDAGKLYAATVVSQNTSDGTLSLIPDDARIRGLGLSRVPVRYGLPGSTAEVAAGTRCQVGFIGGDLSQPFACLFEGGTAGTKLGSLLVVQNPTSFAVTVQFFSAGTTEDAAAVVAQAAALAAGNTAVIVPIKPTVTA